jgi:hypothetical protein
MSTNEFVMIYIMVVMAALVALSPMIRAVYQLLTLEPPKGKWRIVTKPDSFELQRKVSRPMLVTGTFWNFETVETFATEAEARAYVEKVEKAENTPAVYLP